MTTTPSRGSTNGAASPARLIALVIEADIERNLDLRRAIRATGLFETVLSAMSLRSAVEIVSDEPPVDIALVLVSVEMAPRILASLPDHVARRSVIVADIEFAGADRPVLLRPVTADAVASVMAHLG